MTSLSKFSLALVCVASFIGGAVIALWVVPKISPAPATSAACEQSSSDDSFFGGRVERAGSKSY